MDLRPQRGGAPFGFRRYRAAQKHTRVPNKFLKIWSSSLKQLGAFLWFPWLGRLSQLFKGPTWTPWSVSAYKRGRAPPLWNKTR